MKVTSIEYEGLSGLVSLRPSTVEGANEGANTLFDTVDTLFGTVDREGVGNEEGANLLLLPPLWSALPPFSQI